jgi:hypothetical protein
MPPRVGTYGTVWPLGGLKLGSPSIGFKIVIHENNIFKK